MIYLFENILPNYGNDVHQYFTDVNKYVEFLGNPVITFQESAYTLNGNICLVNLPEGVDYMNITYIAWNFKNHWRFYHVTTSRLQSQYAAFDLSDDIWANYIYRAALSDIKIMRCNRNIGVGVYDPISVTNETTYTRLEEPPEIDEISILFVVVYSTGASTIFGNGSGTAISLYSIDLPSTLDIEPVDMDTFEVWVYGIGGIYGQEGRDASVINAYVVPRNVLTPKAHGIRPTFSTSSPAWTGTLRPSKEVSPSISFRDFEIDSDPNYKKYAGTQLNGLEMVRTTTKAKIRYVFNVKQDGLQVTVNQGDRAVDITNAFRLGLTTNDGNMTAQQQIGNILQTVGSLAGGVAGIATGGYGYITGAIGIANAINNSVTSGNARYVAGGDGMSVWRREPTNTFESPFFVVSHKSVDDEARTARMTGAAFNEYVDDLATVFNKSLLGTGTAPGTFVVADVHVSDVPAAAVTAIETTFSNGVYLNYLQ